VRAMYRGRFKDNPGLLVGRFQDSKFLRVATSEVGLWRVRPVAGSFGRELIQGAGA